MSGKEVVRHTGAFELARRFVASNNLGKIGEEHDLLMFDSVSDPEGFQKYLKRNRADRLSEFLADKMSTVEVKYPLRDEFPKKRFETTVLVFSHEELEDLLLTFGENLVNEVTGMRLVYEARRTQERFNPHIQDTTNPR